MRWFPVNKRYFVRTVSLAALSIITSLLVIGCGSSASDSAAEDSFERISDFDRILSIADVENAGWKETKTYDVEGLDSAEDAQVGFWKHPVIGPLDYEIRVYPSHQVALDDGTPFAEDASGEDAALNSTTSMWDDGVRDRRLMVGQGGGTQTAKFGDFVILGNLVILCQGRNSEQALEQCAPFIAQIRGDDS
ncbi:MAG: hypothetical protein HOJ22_03460 [Chloroflexi bacterium]|jgi:hypothetical protein|nr:hypothetical protein [Chloroflexota bacterium]MBT5627325.1 hypothetical protein [Chloroflexota bacterium]